jgi:hypothetical protein
MKTPFSQPQVPALSQLPDSRMRLLMKLSQNSGFKGFHGRREAAQLRILGMAPPSLHRELIPPIEI